ncbi:phytoene/squalene synthase family protein [Arachidicoccus soli]|uniref:Phytoene/squalene synthase family protein n=1 Tax=Arachidicoccus soli TaxID=2341117 RepID=A0A386HQ57_9BACT|nr:phytoene/squalene synthase family protein [Arachidicoccus soli]AYD47832.1 phytoene/squalene synthase family protein [Arachidicoccus soli]
MKQLFDNLSFDVSKITTKSYSTSFSLGILLIDKRLRQAIYAIYGFVRIADEIVDSFDSYDKKYLLEKFKNDTYESIEMGISTNPILNSFQHVVKEFSIDKSLIETFLQSMEMDLSKINYNDERYEQYILGSAEVVGLMCLYVFAEGNKDSYEALKPFAMKLGAAFQKVNFLRDMKDDYQVLGRTYFPNVNLTCFTDAEKEAIERDVAEDFAIAKQGIKMLPATSRGGVYLAYVYYVSLFNKIKRIPSHQLLKERVRINNGKKIRLMLNCIIQEKINLV